ncbi:MAG TPA: hypothetical protein VFZ65_23170 [Planctomycetota bacterium]|nr:hypothetical protein [Planctomycetota bacterium]
MRDLASAMPEVAAGTSCNQSSFKTRKGAFLFVGPGAGGRGFKAMFKLARSLPQAAELSAKHPDRFEVGTPPWVTARFSAEQPLPASIWRKWLQESYELALGAGAVGGKKAPKKTARKQ